MVLSVEVLPQLGATAMTHEVEIRTGSSGLPNTLRARPQYSLLQPGRGARLPPRAAHAGGGNVARPTSRAIPTGRDDTIKAVQVALGLGMDTRFILATPLIGLDKAQTWRMAESLGGDALLELITEADPQLLSGRPKAQARVGLRLRQVPGLQAAERRIPKNSGISEGRARRSGRAAARPPRDAPSRSRAAKARSRR